VEAKVVALLQVREMTKTFGGLTANHKINIHLEEGKIVGLIGPNGAGKTTLFNCISGFYKPDSGSVLFDGREITGMPPHLICKLGLSRTFQKVRIFKDMTVLDNVMVGAFCRCSQRPRAQREAEEVLAFAGLADKADIPGHSLTIADKKRVEIARALATRPRMLLLDEAIAGLNPKETEEAINLINAIRDRGITILLVEHVMEAIMPISDCIVVLESGMKIAEGVTKEIVRNPKVIQAYLGERYRA
jgi:branched-chain amino acid transport system ATP-binding protein